MNFYKCKSITFLHGKQTITEPEKRFDNGSVLYSGEYAYIVTSDSREDVDSISRVEFLEIFPYMADTIGGVE